MRFPRGLATEVDERGTGLPAGERQLIALARVALADPAIAILDEALSNVDPGTETVVRQAESRLMQERTVVIIAHRQLTAERADRVAFIRDGVLVDYGPHPEILVRRQNCAELWQAERGLSSIGERPATSRGRRWALIQVG